MLLSSMACADTYRFSSDDNVSYTEYNYNAHVEFCGDQCSPFCSCACCVGFTSTPRMVVMPITNDVAKIPFFYLDEHFKASKYSFLQPPRA